MTDIDLTYHLVNIATGELLAEFDPDWTPPGGDGRERCGRVRWTTDPTEAMVFPSAAAAWACWRTRSTVWPTRYDGKPNRPLTAFTAEIRPVKEFGETSLSS